MWIKTLNGHLVNSKYIKCIFLNERKDYYSVLLYGKGGDEYFYDQFLTKESAQICIERLGKELNTEGKKCL